MTAISSSYVNPYGNPQLDKNIADTMRSVQDQLNLFSGTTSSTSSADSENYTTKEEYLKTKGCTDGKDDGKIGFFSAVGNIFKGAVNMVVNTVKDIVTDPKKLLMAAGTAVLCAAFPPLGLALAGVGIVSGGAKIASGVSNAMNATTDAEAKAAFQDIGAGGLTVGLSVAGAKASVKQMGTLKSGLADPATGKISLSKAFKKDTTYTLPDGSTATGFTGFRKAVWADAKASPLGQKVSSFVDDVKTNAPAKARARIEKQNEALKDSLDKVDDSVKNGNLDDLNANKSRIEKQLKTATDDADKTSSLTKQLNETNKQIREVENYQRMARRQQNYQKALDSTDDIIKPQSQDYIKAAKDKLPSRSSSKPSDNVIDKLDSKLIDDSIKKDLRFNRDVNGKITKADIDALDLSPEQLKVLQDAGIAPKNTITFKEFRTNIKDSYKEGLENNTALPIRKGIEQSLIFELSKDDSSQEYLQQYA